ncbi:MAG: hypothetical protein PHX51_03270 [Clostridia bacterium]|nr:hypothetical protein [Clostridia bacterium]
MKLLKVNYNDLVEQQTLKFEMDDKAENYDWTHATNLIDCINQVFRSDIYAKNANIEIFFELKDKRYCAGLKSVKNKLNSYLAGEVNGRLVLLGFNYKSVIDYLDAEIGGSFLDALEKCLLNQELFNKFTGSRNAEFFGMVKQAYYESKQVFDSREVDRLRKLAERPENKELIKERQADVDKLSGELVAIDEKIKEIENEKESFSVDSSNVDNAKKELEELNKAREKNDAKLLVAINSDKARKILQKDNSEELKHQLAQLKEEEAALHKSKEQAQKALEELERKNNATEDGNKKRAVIIAAIASIDNDLKNYDKQIAEKQAEADKLNKQKEEALRAQVAAKEAEKKQAEDKKEADKRQKELEELQKKQADLNQKIQDLNKQISDEQEKQKQIKQNSDEIRSLGFTQAQYNEEQLNNRRNVEKSNENLEAAKMFDEKKAAVSREKDEALNELDGLEKRLAELELQIAEAEEDLDPKRKLKTTQKYFGRGYTPVDVKHFFETLAQKLKSLKLERDETNKRIAKAKEVLEKLDKSEKELDQAKANVLRAQSEPVKQKDFFAGKKLTPTQEEYKEALKQGKGDVVFAELDKLQKENDDKQNELKKEQNAAKKDLEKNQARQKALLTEVNKEKTDIKVVESTEEKPFDGQDKIDALAKEIAELKTKKEQSDKEKYDKQVVLAAIPTAEKANGDKLKKELDKADAELEKNKASQKDAEDKLNACQNDSDIKWAREIILVPVADKKNTEKELEENAKAIKDKEEEISKFEKANKRELSKHGKECDEKLQELNDERTHKSGELDNANNILTDAKEKYGNKTQAKKLLEAQQAQLAAVVNRQFNSNKQAQEYLDKFIRQANRTLRDISDKKLGLEFGDNIELEVLDTKKNRLDWQSLDDTQVLLVYLACLDVAPFTNHDDNKWILIDEDLNVDKKTAENALDKLDSIQCKFAFNCLDELPETRADFAEEPTDLTAQKAEDKSEDVTATVEPETDLKLENNIEKPDKTDLKVEPEAETTAVEAHDKVAATESDNISAQREADAAHEKDDSPEDGTAKTKTDLKLND